MIRIAFILFFSMVSCSMSNTIISSWVSREIIVDGNNSEWQENELMVSSGTFVSVANDNDNLFISLRTNNERLAHKISLFGLTLWINHNGKKKRTSAFCYPIEQKESLNMLKNIKSERDKMPSVCDLIGYTSNRAGINYGDDNIKYMPLTFLEKQHIKPAVGCENSLFTYEIKIPLKNYDKEILPFRIDKNSNEIRLCFESGSLDMNNMKTGERSGNGSSMSMHSKGGGGRPGGGKGGGGGGRAGGSMKGGLRESGGPTNNSTGNMKSSLMTNSNIWIKVELAKNE